VSRGKEIENRGQAGALKADLESDRGPSAQKKLALAPGTNEVIKKKKRRSFKAKRDQ